MFCKPAIHIEWVCYYTKIMMLTFSVECVFLVFGHNETCHFEVPSPHCLATQLVQSQEIAVSILVTHHFQSLQQLKNN